MMILNRNVKNRDDIIPVPPVLATLEVHTSDIME